LILFAYTEKHAARYPSEYLAGITLFNDGEFHAAHDVWEERWLETAGQEKLFLQAMIQSAVAFYLIELGRLGAARRLYLAAKEKFGWLGVEKFMSLDLVAFQKELDGALSWLLDAPDPKDLNHPEIVPPKIFLLEEVTEFD
jgi:hypothetical protein